MIASANKQVIVEGDTDHSPFANGARQILNLKQLSPTVFGILQSLKSEKGLTSLRLFKQYGTALIRALMVDGGPVVSRVGL